MQASVAEISSSFAIARVQAQEMFPGRATRRDDFCADSLSGWYMSYGARLSTRSDSTDDVKAGVVARGRSIRRPLGFGGYCEKSCALRARVICVPSRLAKIDTGTESIERLA